MQLILRIPHPTIGSRMCAAAVCGKPSGKISGFPARLCLSGRAGLSIILSNTAMAAVVSFTRHPGTQPPDRKVEHPLSECINFDLHFGISQEQCMKKLVFAS